MIHSTEIFPGFSRASCCSASEGRSRKREAVGLHIARWYFKVLDSDLPEKGCCFICKVRGFSTEFGELLLFSFFLETKTLKKDSVEID